jgi:N-acetylglucosamine kinase-like BadF-type ATPase
MKLIVDSGSTKTTWLLQSALPEPSSEFHTLGINPVRDDEQAVRAVVAEAAAKCGEAARKVTSVYFYGAGCIEPYSEVVRKALLEVFPEADNLLVESDLLGAARALCGHQEGIACILGTGANSCLYDGCDIVSHTPALGWILGDEGSGAVLGRLLVGDVLKRQLPEAICAAFFARFHLTQADLIERVYRQPLPNRFLASLVPFLAEHVEEESVHKLLVCEFRRFLVRNVLAYGRPDLAISFVGGVASHFREQLQEAVEAEGYRLGRIEAEPVRGMALFHR